MSEARQLALLFAAAYGSHILLDFIAADTSAPCGVPLFWPLIKTHYILPAPLLMDIRRVQGDSLSFLLSIGSSHNLLAVMWEVIILTPFAILVGKEEVYKLLRRCLAFLSIARVSNRIHRSSEEASQ